jgi:hypothetical protein
MAENQPVKDFVKCVAKDSRITGYCMGYLAQLSNEYHDYWLEIQELGIHPDRNSKKDLTDRKPFLQKLAAEHLLHMKQVISDIEPALK